MAFAGVSEYTLFSFNRVHESYVRRLLVKRGIMAFLTFLIIDAALCCIFILVPGYPL
jgi:hypothetical protein